MKVYSVDFIITCYRGTSRCGGRRDSKRILLKQNPVMVVRVYEHCLFDRTTIDYILATQDLAVTDSRYRLAGVTMLRDSHYAAVVMFEGLPYWYDGLIGELNDIPHDMKTWFPCHAVYCKIS